MDLEASEISNKRPLCVYVDVDDTLVRSAGTKRIPIPAVIEHVKELKRQGTVLYCWSSGGADYAKLSAEELGIANCFVAFLTKPDVLLDDQKIQEWRYLLQIHPTEHHLQNLENYRSNLNKR